MFKSVLEPLSYFYCKDLSMKWGGGGGGGGARHFCTLSPLFPWCGRQMFKSVLEYTCIYCTFVAMKWGALDTFPLSPYSLLFSLFLSLLSVSLPLSLSSSISFLPLSLSPIFPSLLSPLVPSPFSPTVCMSCVQVFYLYSLRGQVYFRGD